MKAIIFKNDDFETVGIKVTNNETTMFQWGVNWEDGYYTKTIDADKYTKEICDLMALKVRKEFYGTFNTIEQAIIDTWQAEQNQAKMKKGGCGVFIPYEIREKEVEYEKSIKNIVNKIK